jgi:hypothetical protein
LGEWDGERKEEKEYRISNKECRMKKDDAPKARVKKWREAPPFFDIRCSLFIIRYPFLAAACCAG